MDVFTLLIILHVVGTILGTGGATVAELQITRALKDKKVSKDERALMHVNYGMIRAGMAIMLVSVIGMFWYFHTQGSDVLFTSEKLWIKDVMLVAIFVNAVALQKRWVPLWLGASISFTSWWGATLLGLAGQLPYSFTTYVIGYVVAIFAIAGVLHVFRLGVEKGLLQGRTVLVAFGAIVLLLALFVFYLIEGEQAREQVPQVDTQEAAYHQTLSHIVEYDIPDGVHVVKFSVSLDEDGVVENVGGTDLTDPDHQANIDEFVGVVKERIVGTPLSELGEIDKVGTSSLTTDAFNESLRNLQQQL